MNKSYISFRFIGTMNTYRTHNTSENTMNFPIALIVANFELGISSKNKFRSRTEAFNWLKDEIGMTLEELQNLELNIQWKRDCIHIYMIEW